MLKAYANLSIKFHSFQINRIFVAYKINNFVCCVIFVYSIFIDGLHYSDGSKNNTLDHQWFIHLDEVTKDYFDWRNRCISAGSHFNPYKV